jgi:hypothetical protein
MAPSEAITQGQYDSQIRRLIVTAWTEEKYKWSDISHDKRMCLFSYRLPGEKGTQRAARARSKQ